MKRFFCAILLVSTLLCCLSLYSCTSPSKKYSNYTFDYFDTVTSVTGYAQSQEEFDRVFDSVTGLLKEYHQLFTIYDRYDGINNLRTVNELSDGVHKPVKVDQKIIDLLLFCKDMHIKTNGRVNVAMGSVLSIWHEYRQNGLDDPETAKLPPMDKLTEASEHTDIEKLIIDREASTVFLSDPEMLLDVGAIAKGYAVEQIAQTLIQSGITGYVLNVGGNVRAIGLKGDKSPWVAGIDDPGGSESSPYYATLSLEDRSLVTSGSYQRYYTVDGKDYHHIIDPDTLMPSLRYVSVSIVCESSAVADALSTALFCMSVEDGKAVLDSFGEAEAMWVTAEGDIQYSQGFSKYIQEIKNDSTVDKFNLRVI